jgi:hypothetical protein
MKTWPFSLHMFVLPPKNPLTSSLHAGACAASPSSGILGPGDVRQGPGGFCNAAARVALLVRAAAVTAEHR